MQAFVFGKGTKKDINVNTPSAVGARQLALHMSAQLSITLDLMIFLDII